MASSPINAVSPECLLKSLRTKGYVILDLSERMSSLSCRVFDLFQSFDARSVAEKMVFELLPDTNGEHNGYHAIGGISAYNRCREGYIFQAASPVWPMLSESVECEGDEFSTTHEIWRAEMHHFALIILDKVWEALGIHSPAEGVLDVVSGSQFQVKKICWAGIDPAATLSQTEDGEFVTMPTHCDPSFISIVIHSQIFSGLQVRDAEKRAFVHIPPTGPGKCVVFAGSLLELITNSEIKPCVHRVVSTEADMISAKRIAATFFFQPTNDSFLVPLRLANDTSQSAVCDEEVDSKIVRRFTISSIDDTVSTTYGTWKSRVYGNYYKGRKVKS